MRLATEDVSFGRDFVFKKAKESVDKLTKGKYPAAYEILSCVEHGLGKPSAEAFAFEAEAFVRLAKTKESSALIGLFDGITAAKKNPYASASTTKPSSVAVLGAGLMGAGIAQVSAEKGLQVALKDVSPEGLAKGVAYVAGNLDKKVKRRRLDAFTRNTTLSRITGYHDAAGGNAGAFATTAGDLDVCVEAVFENLELKHKVFGSVSSLVGDDCVLATNTSAIPIGNVAAGIAKPERVLGMHYFSPVPQMQLLEIIPHAGTNDESMAKAFAGGIKQGKTCIEVADVPGFYVNRALAPMMAEVGADVGLHVQHTMLADATMGCRMAGAKPEMLQHLVDQNWRGRKDGKGFFVYRGKKKEPHQQVLDYVESSIKLRDAEVTKEQIQDRYLSRFVNEALICLQEGILKSPADGDLGAVFGTGFLPFTGDAVGAQLYADKLSRLADEHGDHFAPCALLLDHAKAGTKFYP